MSDLISRSTLIEAFEKEKQCKNYGNDLWSKSEIKAIIENTPTVKAEPVVHCKDCVHWGTGVAGETEHVKCCEYGKYMVGENGYCCYADMRGEKHD